MPGTPSASAVSQDSDLTHGQRWWLPQPRPSLDEAHQEWRPAVPLVEALQCRLCSDLLKEAITTAECGHSYCYDCIDERITIGGRANFCPVCNVLLGPNPYEHNKLKYDFILDSLVRKVFPRPLLDAALEARRLDREEATRQAKATINRRPGKAGVARTVSSGNLAGQFVEVLNFAFENVVVITAKRLTIAYGVPDSGVRSVDSNIVSGRLSGAYLAPDSGDYVQLGLFPASAVAAGSTAATGLSAASGQPEQHPLGVLPRPYIRAPASLTVGGLKSWLSDRLEGKRGQAKVAVPPVELLCAGQLLDSVMTMKHLQDDIWTPYCAKLPAATPPPQGAEGNPTPAATGSSRGGAAPATHLPHSGEHVMLVVYRAAAGSDRTEEL
eukprot:gene5715-5955_t